MSNDDDDQVELVRIGNPLDRPVQYDDDGHTIDGGTQLEVPISTMIRKHFREGHLIDVEKFEERAEKVAAKAAEKAAADEDVSDTKSKSGGAVESTQQPRKPR